MSASATVYCLEKITDYFEFERLCHDLMSRLGYAKIEPLGGFKDRGRDAIHVNAANETTIFAYSVREDWRAKLAEDAHKIARYEHACDRLVFVTTSVIPAPRRDEAVTAIELEYGWELDIYGVERLRVLLDNRCADLKAKYPQFFPPEMVQMERIEQRVSSRHVLITYDGRDNALAKWLARKLAILGFSVWCADLPDLSEKPYPEDLAKAMKSEVSAIVGLFSCATISNPDLMRTNVLATSTSDTDHRDIMIPVKVDEFDENSLDSITSRLNFVDFRDSWADGLKHIQSRLRGLGVAYKEHVGAQAVVSSLDFRTTAVSSREVLYSNCFEVKSIPPAVVHILLEQDAPKDQISKARDKWPFRRISDRSFLCFTLPPSGVLSGIKVRSVEVLSWREKDLIRGIIATDVVIELLRKSLVAKCHDSGLSFCEVYRLHYFPFYSVDQRNRLPLEVPSGSKTWIKAAGERTYRRASGNTRYRYHLSPVFYVRRDLLSEFDVVLDVRLRFSHMDGSAIVGSKAVTLRKRLCRDWWNREWFLRNLAIMQFFATDGEIAIAGHDGPPLIVSSNSHCSGGGFGVG